MPGSAVKSMVHLNNIICCISQDISRIKVNVAFIRRGATVKHSMIKQPNLRIPKGIRPKLLMGQSVKGIKSMRQTDDKDDDEDDEFSDNFLSEETAWCNNFTIFYNVCNSFRYKKKSSNKTNFTFLIKIPLKFSVWQIFLSTW